MDRGDGGWGAPVVWAALLALLLLRAVVAFAPSMWAWGLNTQRFIPPLLAWIPWGAAALLLHPAIAGRVAPHLTRVGDRLAGGRFSPWLAALTGAAVVWAFPDRLWITGDFLLRQGTAESGAFPNAFIQALPIEVLLNRVGGLSSTNPNAAPRAIGAIAAAGLALVAVHLVRDWGLTGIAAVIGVGTIFLGGYLTSFTGLGKPAALICLATALCLLGAMRLVRSGRGAGLLGVTLGIAFLTHRSALALIPLWFATLAQLLVRRGSPGPRGRNLMIAGLIPVAGIAMAGPMIIGIVRHFDLPRHIAPHEVVRRGLLAAALAPLHLLDLTNLVLFFTPAVITALVVFVCMGPRTARRAETWLIGLLALSFVPVLLFIHPIQGIFRDVEVFAPAGVAFALAAAYVTAAALQGGRLPAWLGPALLASVLVPSLHSLALFNDAESGLRRGRSFATEAPTRDEGELAQIWDVIAYRAFRMRDWEQAVEASAHAARYAPHPRALMMWAIARTYTGDHRGAESLYVSLTERTADDPLVWVGLGGAALRAGDSVQTARALARLDAYAPDGREARAIRRHLQIFPEVWPSTREVVGGEAGGTRR